jgi:hypothetical protein
MPMKRLLSCYPSDYKNISAEDLKTAIIASEGRTILGETVVTAAPLLEGVTNAEVMTAFGADLLVLNEFDVFEKEIVGMETTENPIQQIKDWVGRPIGINLEPVDEAAFVHDEQVTLSPGRLVSKESLQAADKLGIDFIMLTGNPATGVSMAAIEEASKQAKEHYSGLVFAGKMHGAGLAEDIIDIAQLEAFVRAGADGVLIPASGTAPGVTEEAAFEATKAIHQLGGVVISTIGTSQESADSGTIREIGLSNKRVGVDIHHIGDGDYGRMPAPENMMQLGLTVRGKRHTYFKMAQSLNR